MNKEIGNLVKDLFESLQIPARLVQIPCKDWHWWDQGLRSDILKIENVANRCNSWVMQLDDRCIYHMTDEFKCSYTVFKEKEGYCFFAGPVLFEKIEEDVVTHLKKQLALKEDTRDRLKEYYSHISVFTSQLAYEKLFHLIGKYLWGEQEYQMIYLDAEDMKSWDDIYKTYGLQSSVGKTKNNIFAKKIESVYQLEDSMMMAVSRGNDIVGINSLEQWQILKFPNIRYCNLEKMREECFALNALFRKTVYQSGVQPIHVERYSEKNISLIRQLTDVEKAISLQKRFVLGYCKLVKNMQQKTYSQVTQKVVNYIDTDICADLQLKTLASRFGITPNYLSSLFHKEVGISLIEYVNCSRIQHAKRLLLSTGDTIKKVALACGFSDSYYFCRIFKKNCGMTPTEYRKSVGYEEFIKLQSKHILANKKTD